ncbi:MAG: hypothetical protein AAGB93_04985 [Planctomycetota bacterium]
MRPPARRAAARTALAALAAALCIGARDVRSFTLGQLVDASDGAVVGRIDRRSVEEVDAGDGSPIYFTTLRIEGTDLATGEAETIDVMYPGGFVDERRGAFNASMPAAHETRVGRGVVVFHDRRDDVVGGLRGELLLGGRASLFPTFESRRGATIVQGRGRGYAVSKNVRLTDLQARVRELRRAKRETR